MQLLISKVLLLIIQRLCYSLKISLIIELRRLHIMRHFMKQAFLYYDPILCAKKINSIHSNPMEWWMEEEVQKAKNYYSDYFCRINKNYNEQLAQVIKSMI